MHKALRAIEGLLILPYLPNHHPADAGTDRQAQFGLQSFPRVEEIALHHVLLGKRTTGGDKETEQDNGERLCRGGIGSHRIVTACLPFALSLHLSPLLQHVMDFVVSLWLSAAGVPAVEGQSQGELGQVEAAAGCQFDSPRSELQ